ncbi:MAG: methylenetetrahydrofolate reductase C-terminal domain-containing protein [Pseudomonadota bacterium]|nr:methylenetetrahydrofolate reductase C-terminal domain-containing protein [Pseudomonadota bacterium]
MSDDGKTLTQQEKAAAPGPVVTQATRVAQAKPKTAYTPSHVSPSRRQRKGYTIRLWSVRHARFLEWFYDRFANLFLMLHPFWKAVGYARAEAPVTFVERRVKGLLFDCRMCGQCILSSTGMSCPMNCPKQLRNGPCGGVRANGNCEVEPDMPCVWVQAWNGASAMRHGSDAILAVQKPVDQSLRETSAWLRVTASKAAANETVPGEAAS